MKDRIVHPDLVNSVIYCIKKNENEDKTLAEVTPVLKNCWFALKHEIDIHYGSQDWYPSAYVYDSKGHCIWGFDGCFEARGVSSSYLLDKQLENKHLLVSKFDT